MAVKYLVSKSRFSAFEGWWFDSEEEARDKLAELLATSDLSWDVVMRRVVR